MANYELGSLVWRVKGDTRDFDKNIKNADTQTKKFSGRLSGGAKSLLKWGGAAAAAALSIGKVVSTVKESVKAYGEQITAERTLAAAIDSTGESADELLPRYKEIASEIQNLTTVGDETTLALMQQAQALGINSEEMEDATKGAIGLSKSLGIGTQQAIRGVANALQGNFTTLQRYIPELRNTEDESEKLAIVQEKMANGFETAKAEADSGYGALQQYDNALGDLKEQMGESVVEGIEPLVSGLTDLISRWTANIEKTRLFKDTLSQLRNAEEEAFASESVAQLEERLAAAREEAESYSAAASDYQAEQKSQANIVVARLEEQIAKQRELEETERQRQLILDKYGDTSEEYQEFIETQQAVELEAAKKLEEVRRQSLSQAEREEENVQEQINYWDQYRGKVEGAEEIFTALVQRRTELRKQIEEEKEATEENNEAQEVAIARFGARLDVEGEELDTLVAIGDRYFENEKAAGEWIDSTKDKFADLTQSDREQLQEQVDDFRAAGVDKVALREWEKERLEEIQEDETDDVTKFLDKMQEEYGEAFDAINGIVGQAFNTHMMALDNEEERVKQKFDAELAALKEKHENEEISDEEYAKRKEEIEKEKAEELYQIELAQFRAQQKKQIYETLIATAQMAVQAYKALAGIPVVGPALGAAAAAAATAFGMKQVSLIQSQPEPPPPQFAEGGFVQPRPGTPGTGDNVNAQLNPREVVLTESDANELLSSIRSGNTGGGPTRVTVNLDRKSLLDAVSKGSDNGEVIINSRAVR